jgi:AraC family transcriptional regulator
MDRMFRSLLLRLKENGMDQEETDEWCMQVLGLLFGQSQKERTYTDHIMAAKPATRQELYRRLSLSVDMMHQAYATRLTLHDLSMGSCLSVYHLHRLFRQVYGITPYHYLTRIRLQVASEMLRQTDFLLQDICLACGFEDESSFIRLFKKHYYLTPHVFRKFKD